MKRGFSLFEVLIYLSIAFVVLTVVVGFVFWLIDSNNKNRIIRDVSNSAERSMEIITHEIREAKSVYTPTTSTEQLSLQTSHYLPANETSTYIDFYLCSSRLCFKKESQDQIVLTPDNIEVSSLSFDYISPDSVKIDMTLKYKNISGRPDYNFSTSLSSSAAIRSYEK
jgi:type II secretory pathway pseudopilin PulG